MSKAMREICDDCHEMTNSTVNTGCKYVDGKYIFRTIFDIQELESFSGIDGVDFILSVKGMYKDGNSFIPLKIESIGNSIQTTQEIPSNSIGYFVVEYTTQENKSGFLPYIVSVCGILAIIGAIVGSGKAESLLSFVGF